MNVAFVCVGTLNFLVGVASALASPVSPEVLTSNQPEHQRSPQARPANGASQHAQIYRAGVEPHWFGVNDRFWYRNDLRDGHREFILVDAVDGTRQPAFDHKAVATQLLGVENRGALPIESLRFSEDEKRIILIGPDGQWAWDVGSQTLTESRALPSSNQGLPKELPPRPSRSAGRETEITFENQLTDAVELYWVNASGERVSYGPLASGQRRTQHTYAGHVWLVTDNQGTAIGAFEAVSRPEKAVIDATPPTRREPTQRAGFRRSGRSNGASPDGKWRAYTRNHNVFVHPADDQSQAIQLTQDGREGFAYGRLS